ncbi:MAG TPA: flagellar basal body rod C-terminal domain-containing protein [Caproicibacter sp.]|nr:flagellar basal body rod C-terminal domain-containing protein [Caproicibacter sp.]
MSSTFDGLFIARSGVRAARANLNITGQNITNANTDGYTRQRVDQSAIPPCEVGGVWASSGATCGNGVAATGTSQLRDAFLDSEYRTQKANSGETTAEIKALYDMEDIFTTTTTASSSSKSAVIDVLSNEYSNFISQLQALTSGKSTASESTIREEAKLLATKLNITAKSLDKIRSQQYSNLNDYGINKANDLIKSIASYNDQIEKAEIAGSTALELKDQRNLALDQLSQYVGIKVTETPKDIGAGRTVDEMSVCLADEDGNPLKVDGQTYTLVDGKSYAKFTATQDAKNEDGSSNTGSFQITHIRLSGLTDDGATFTANSGTVTNPSPATDSTYYFQIGDNAPQSIQIQTPTGTSLAALKGLVDTAISHNSALAGKISTNVVGDHLAFTTSGGNTLSITSAPTSLSPDNVLNMDGMKNDDLKSGSFSGYLKLLNESGEYDTLSGNATTTMRGIGYYSQLLDSIAQNLASAVNAVNGTNDASDNKPLFTKDGTNASGVTAENIQLSSKWVDGYLTMSKIPPHAGDSTATSYSNITAMITALTNTTQNLKSTHMVLGVDKGITIFNGTLEKAFASVSTMLGQDVSSVQSTNNTNSSLLNNIDSSRQEISSVSIDDEAIDMVQFNQALSASSRFMTAVDECLQTIINSMGVAGRG